MAAMRDPERRIAELESAIDQLHAGQGMGSVSVDADDYQNLMRIREGRPAKGEEATE
jgi:hypothetical protein